MVGEDGKVQLNRNMVNGSPSMLGLLGGLPPDSPVAFEAAFGWGGAATLAQLLRADLLPEAWIAPPPVLGIRLPTSPGICVMTSSPDSPGPG